jgi:hypothetical protein
LRKGVIDKETKYAITKVAKNIYFPFRTYQNIVEETIKRFPKLDDKARRFEAYIVDNRKSLKERDALKLIEYIRDMV